VVATELERVANQVLPQLSDLDPISAHLRQITRDDFRTGLVYSQSQYADEILQHLS
jgi:hypothetical protein